MSYDTEILHYDLVIADHVVMLIPELLLATRHQFGLI
jgi:hypothetical protein